MSFFMKNESLNSIKFQGTTLESAFEFVLIKMSHVMRLHITFGRIRFIAAGVNACDFLTFRFQKNFLF